MPSKTFLGEFFLVTCYTHNQCMVIFLGGPQSQMYSFLWPQTSIFMLFFNALIHAVTEHQWQG